MAIQMPAGRQIRTLAPTKQCRKVVHKRRVACLHSGRDEKLKVRNTPNPTHETKGEHQKPAVVHNALQRLGPNPCNIECSQYLDSKSWGHWEPSASHSSHDACSPLSSHRRGLLSPCGRHQCPTSENSHMCVRQRVAPVIVSASMVADYVHGGTIQHTAATGSCIDLEKRGGGVGSRLSHLVTPEIVRQRVAPMPLTVSEIVTALMMVPAMCL